MSLSAFISKTFTLSCIAIMAFAIPLAQLTPQVASAATTPIASFVKDDIVIREGSTTYLRVKLNEPITETTRVTVEFEPDEGTKLTDVRFRDSVTLIFSVGGLTTKSIPVRTFRTASEGDKGLVATISGGESARVTILDQKTITPTASAGGTTASSPAASYFSGAAWWLNGSGGVAPSITTTGGTADIGFDASYTKTKAVQLEPGQTYVYGGLPMFHTSSNIPASITSCSIQKKNGTNWAVHGNFIPQPNQSNSTSLPSFELGVGTHEYRYICGNIISSIATLTVTSGTGGTALNANIGFDTSFSKTKTQQVSTGQTIGSKLYLTSSNVPAPIVQCHVEKKNGTTWDTTPVGGAGFQANNSPAPYYTLDFPAVGVGTHEYRYVCGTVISPTATFTVTTGPTGTGGNGVLPAPTQIIHLDRAGQWNRRAEVNASIPETATINQGEVLGIKVDPSVWNLFIQPQFLWIAQIQSTSPENQADLNSSLINNPVLRDLIMRRQAQDAIVQRARIKINADGCNINIAPLPTNGSTTAIPRPCPISLHTEYHNALREFNNLHRQIHQIIINLPIRFYDPIATDPAFTVEVVDQNNNVYSCPGGYIGGVNTDGQAQFGYRNPAGSNNQSMLQDCSNVRPGKIWTVKIRLNHCKYNWQSGEGRTIRTGSSQDAVCSKSFKVYNDLYYR